MPEEPCSPQQKREIVMGAGTAGSGWLLGRDMHLLEARSAYRGGDKPQLFSVQLQGSVVRKAIGKLVNISCCASYQQGSDCSTPGVQAGLQHVLRLVVEGGY